MDPVTVVGNCLAVDLPGQGTREFQGTTLIEIYLKQFQIPKTNLNQNTYTQTAHYYIHVHTCTCIYNV